MLALSAEDQVAYRKCLKLFDQCEYQKGLKATQKLLVKYPEDGELNCTKGLFLVYLNKLEDGLASIKYGLLKNLKSSTCWHIYGIYYKVVKNYDEACKCYLKATSFDNTNMGIKRDLCTILGHNRMYSQLIGQLLMIVHTQPTPMARIQLFLAYYFTKDYKNAFDSIEDYEETFPQYDREFSNIILFKIDLYLLLNRPAQGIKYIEKYGVHCLDPIGLLEGKAQLYFMGQKYEKSLPLFKELLQFNSEDPKYVEGFLLSKCKINKYEPSCKSDWINALTSLNNEFSSFFIRFKLIDIADNKQELLKSFMTRVLGRQSPGFWRLFKHIYDQDSKLYNDTMDSLNLDKTSVKYYWFVYANYSQYNDLKDLQQSQHYFDQLALLPHYKQLSTSDKIDHIVAHSKLFKKKNEFEKAANILTEAQQLDPGDRSINVRKVKYLIRARLLDKAILELQCFLRKEPKLDQVKELLSVQCFWLSFELLKYFENTTVFIKLAKLILNYFHEMKLDDVDFQGFCTRKATVNPFIDYSEWLDTGMNHRFILKAGLYLADHFKTFSLKNDLVVDTEQLESIFGKEEQDLDGALLYKSFNVKNALLEVAELLNKINHSQGKLKAFKIYYELGITYLYRPDQEVRGNRAGIR